MSGTSPLPPDDACREQLVAYLDGELAPAAAREVESQLDADPELRRQLQDLDLAWAQLEFLPRHETRPDFTRTTVEMVALRAAEPDEEHDARAGWLRWGGLSLGGMLVAVVAGYLVAGSAWPDPNRGLLDNLPALERYDQLRRVERIELLERLREENLFPEEPRDAS